MKLKAVAAVSLFDTWVLEVDLNKAPKFIAIPRPDYFSPFTDAMDANFINPFDGKRIGAWLRCSGRARTYWTYVQFPGRAK